MHVYVKFIASILANNKLAEKEALPTSYNSLTEHHFTTISILLPYHSIVLSGFKVNNCFVFCFSV